MLEFRIGIIASSPAKKNQTSSTLSLSFPLEGILSVASLGAAPQHSGNLKAAPPYAKGEGGLPEGHQRLLGQERCVSLQHRLPRWTGKISLPFAELHRRQLLLCARFSRPVQLCARRGSALSPRLETPPQPHAKTQGTECPALSPAFRNGDQNLQGFHSVLLVLSVLVIVAHTAWLATLLFFHGTACSDSGPEWCSKPARGQS